MSVSEPSKILTPWATSGLKNAIPENSNPVTGNAGYDQGFPAINMTPKESGGIPPFGQDFNGIFFDVTQILQYMQAGGHPTYSLALSDAIGGYPLGAMLAKISGAGFWRNTVENNTSNPDTGGAGWISDSAGSYTNATVITASSTSLTVTQSGQAFLFTAAGASVALPAASGVPSGGVYKLHTSAGLTVSVTGGGAMQAGSASVTSLVIPAGTEVQAVSTGSGWWVFGTGQALPKFAVDGSIRNLKASSSGTSPTVTVTADQMALDSAVGGLPLLVSAVSLSLSTAVSGVNGLDVGAAAASTWYSVWVVSNGATTAGLLSLSASAPTLPPGYTFRRRVGWIRTDGTANKYPLSFIQAGRSVQYKVAAGSNLPGMPAAASGVAGNVLTPVWVAVSIGNFVPPAAYKIDVVATLSGSNASIIVAPNNSYGAIGSGINPPPVQIQTATSGTLYAFRTSFMPESSNIYWASGTAGNTLTVHGWEDNL